MLPSDLPVAPSVSLAFPKIVRDDVLTLETGRLWLRWPRPADAEALARFSGETRVAEMTGSVPHPYPEGEAGCFIHKAREANGAGVSLTLLMTPKRLPNEAIGTIALRPAEGQQLSLGYILASSHRDLGLATEAAQAMVDIAFLLTCAREVAAWVQVINPASRRVLEKCGFQSRGSGLRALAARGGLFPCEDLGLDRRTWASLRRWGLGPVPCAAPVRAGPAALLMT